MKWAGDILDDIGWLASSVGRGREYQVAMRAADEIKQLRLLADNMERLSRSEALTHGKLKAEIKRLREQIDRYHAATTKEVL